MAEALGAVASAVNLVQFAGSLAHAAYAICRKLHEVPHELSALSKQLLLVHKELERIERSTAGSRSISNFAPGLYGDLEAALKDVQVILGELGNVVQKRSMSDGIQSRFQWVLKDSKRAERFLRQLKDCRKRLQTCLLATFFDAHTASTSRILAAIDDLKVVSLVTHNSSTHIASIGQSLPSTLTNGLASTAIVKKPRSHRKLKDKPWTQRQVYDLLGVAFVCISTFRPDEMYIEHSMAFGFSTPLALLFGKHFVSLYGTVRTSPQLPMAIRLRNTRFDISRVVNQNDRYMMACRGDNASDVKDFLRLGIGRITDVDDRGWSGFVTAIAFGSTEVVKVFLDNASIYDLDINAPINELQTTPVEWAIWHDQLDVTRLLLSHGASQDHINKDGWNTPFFCWPELDQGLDHMLDFLHMLANHSILDLDLADADGWTVLHRRAAFGTPKEVDYLIQYGAEPLQEALPLRWNAMHHAVHYGNLATFEAILKHYADPLPGMHDVRGWTLLHIAAEAGHVDIVQRLLQLGADPMATSKPYWAKMDESLFGRSCNAAEVAVASLEPVGARAIVGLVPEWQCFACMLENVENTAVTRPLPTPGQLFTAPVWLRDWIPSFVLSAVEGAIAFCLKLRPALSMLLPVLLLVMAVLYF